MTMGESYVHPPKKPAVPIPGLQAVYDQLGWVNDGNALDHDARQINALAQQYVTSFITHVTSDLSFNRRQKGDVQRWCQAHNLDATKFSWYIQVSQAHYFNFNTHVS